MIVPLTAVGRKVMLKNRLYFLCGSSESIQIKVPSQVPCFIGNTDTISLGGGFNQQTLMPFLQQVGITPLGECKAGIQRVAALGWSLRLVNSDLVF